jgi:hypothetical protein
VPPLVQLILFYIIYTLPVYVIAKKSGHDYAWLAFVPIGNLWLLCDMADMELWFLIIFLVPYLNIILLGFVWWRIAENTNKPGWLGILMLIPGVNLLVGYYLAFVETGRFIA